MLCLTQRIDRVSKQPYFKSKNYEAKTPQGRKRRQQFQAKGILMPPHTQSPVVVRHATIILPTLFCIDYLIT